MQIQNGTLMAGTRAIAAIENGKIMSYDDRFLPFFLARTGNLESWLAGRAIDSHRPNSRLLKKALRLKPAEDAEIAMEVNGSTITDNYWFCPSDSTLSYDEIRFRYNYFDRLALCGDPNGFSQNPSRTPELTNIGSFEKCWRWIDDNWWMYKSGTMKEYISELFICRLGNFMGFPMAWYEMDDGYIRTRDFTEGKLNFEAMDGLTGEEDDYSVCFDVLRKLSPILAKEYLKMIWMDTLCYNMDRHTKNFGILRSRETGEILRMAPNYDNNIALISRGYVKDICREKDGLIRFFSDFLTENEQVCEAYRKMLSEGEIPVLDGHMVEAALNEVSQEIAESLGEEKDYIREFVLNGQNVMQQILKVK